MLRKLLFFSIFSSLFFYNCKTTKYTLDTLPENQLYFGDGGGFAGIEIEYMLLENGQLFQKAGDSYDELKSLSKKRAEELFAQLDRLRLHKMDVDNPGNLYYFMRVVTAELDHKITWGAADYSPRQDLVYFYKALKKEVKDRKTVNPAKKSKSEKEAEEEKTYW